MNEMIETQMFSKNLSYFIDVFSEEAHNTIIKWYIIVDSKSNRNNA